VNLIMPFLTIAAGLALVLTAEKARQPITGRPNVPQPLPKPAPEAGGMMPWFASWIDTDKKDVSNMRDTPGKPEPRPGASAARGLRNHNPGNIEKGANWQGLSADQSADERFAVFDSPVYGIRALTKVLLTYRNKYGVRTPEQIIGRWAPDFENDTGSYVAAVAAAAGIAPTDPVTDNELPAVVAAIIKHENGSNPYSAEVLDEGIKKAYA